MIPGLILFFGGAGLFLLLRYLRRHRRYGNFRTYVGLGVAAALVSLLTGVRYQAVVLIAMSIGIGLLARTTLNHRRFEDGDSRRIPW
jgi:hypothetical protein